MKIPSPTPAETPAEAEAPRSLGATIQSVERAYNILMCAARNRDGMKLSEISKDVGLHTSTTFHIVKSLVTLGCLSQDESTKRYRIGRSIFALAAACHAEQDLIELVRPFVDQLSQATGESSHFAVWANYEVMIIVRSHGNGVFQLSEHVGSIRPAHATAIGKALLSGLSKGRFEKWLESVQLPKLTAHTISDPGALLQAVERVKVEGVAYDDCEYNGEARCIAAPVRNFTREIIGSLGISGPVWRLSLNEISKHTDTVRDFAARISKELGYVP